MTHIQEPVPDNSIEDIRLVLEDIRLATELPEASLQECVDRRDEAIPALMAILREGLDDGFVSDEDLSVPYALLLLAEFRHRDAFPLFLELARHPQVEDFLGDMTTESLGRCLAACWDGNPDSLTDLVLDDSIDDNPRSQGVTALVALAVAGERGREEVLADIKMLLREALVRSSPEIASACVIGLWDLYPDDEAEALVREVYAKDLIEDDILPLADFEDVLKEGFESVWNETIEEPLCSLRIDAVSDSEWWSCWHDEDEDDSVQYREDGSWIPPEPIEQLRSEKIERNAPCPCGSGRKYKKCCGTAA